MSPRGAAGEIDGLKGRFSEAFVGAILRRAGYPGLAKHLEGDVPLRQVVAKRLLVREVPIIYGVGWAWLAAVAPGLGL
jgi:hypothetical protein